MRRTSTPGSGTPMLPAGASPSPMAVVTTGDASGRPYPSTRQKENRSCIARRVDSSSRAAPEVARRTVAKESAGAPGSAAHAVHIDDAPLMTVAPWARIASRADWGSQRSISSVVAQAMSDRSSTTFRPKMWSWVGSPLGADGEGGEVGRVGAAPEWLGGGGGGWWGGRGTGRGWRGGRRGGASPAWPRPLRVW